MPKPARATIPAASTVTVERRCGRGSQARALNMTIRTLAVVLCASGRRSARVGAGDSGGDRARGQFGADPGDTVQGDGGEWPMPLGD